MRMPIRCLGPLGTLLTTYLLLLATTHPSGAEPVADPLLTTWRQDGELADVQFIDSLRGWAVGDHGAIWHTSDGGQHWNPQESPVSCRLTSVCFIDLRTGWAVGGHTHRYTHLTSGILLRTDDGGKNWFEWHRNPLPALAKIKFFNKHQGVALGSTSALYPQGLLITRDGGRSWAAVPSRQSGGWRNGEFLDAAHGLLVGSGGVLAAVHDGEVLPTNAKTSAGGNLLAATLTHDALGYAVGEGGGLLVSQDGGLHWQKNDSEFFQQLSDDFVTRSVAAQGPLIWIAGSPGTRILHSADGGQHWEFQNTGQPLPLHDLHFVDKKRGWAVGALGTILATEDGGKTWKVQKGGQRRAAILGIFPTARDVPLELFAKLSAGGGYRSAISLLGRDEPHMTATPHDMPAQRVREAMIQTGATAVDRGWQFPLLPRELNLLPNQIASRWRAHNEQHAETLLERYLVQQIRIWRPDVIVTMEARPRGEDRLATLVNQTLLQAVEKAALAGPSPLGLPPWQISKVYTVLPPRTAGSLQLSGSQLIPQVGCSLTDYVASARSLLYAQDEQPESTLSFTLLLSKLSQRQGRNFFSGLNLSPGGDARRILPEMRINILQHRQLTQATETLRAIVLSSGQGQPSNDAWRGQIHRALRDLPATVAGEVLFDLANQYHQQGKGARSAETLAILINQCPDHVLVSRALHRLIQYYASGESYRRTVEKKQPATRQVRVDLPAIATAVVGPPENPPPQRDVLGQRAETALQWGRQLRKINPGLYADPSVQFPLAAAHRRIGNSHQAEKIYLQSKGSRWLGAWSDCGAAEQSLIRAEGKVEIKSAKPRWICSRANEKPFLDGSLDEPCWSRTDGSEGAEKIAIGNRYNLRGPPTKIQACCDNEYLYFAIECNKVPDRDYPQNTLARTRDARLEARDRVDLLIDIDRDYTTYYQLSVDHHGATYDACWNDASWNPEWFVASRTTENSWICEIAIPLAELTTEPRATKRLWAIGVQRIIPGVGFQSWTEPANPQIDPTGFGYLQLP